MALDVESIPAITDKAHKFSKLVSTLILRKISGVRPTPQIPNSIPDHCFEQICLRFFKDCFNHLKRSNLECCHVTECNSTIPEFEQYRHLHELKTLTSTHPQLATAFDNGHLIAPDIIISRAPFEDEDINQLCNLVDATVARQTPFRKANNETELLLASISCKWTLRSDRAQNARSEALNLIRNRKGRCPHIMVVTAEPTPSRIASLALGTGDIDCVYHFALPELKEAILESQNDEALQLLEIMIDGKRLRDISDLPLDLLA